MKMVKAKKCFVVMSLSVILMLLLPFMVSAGGQKEAEEEEVMTITWHTDTDETDTSWAEKMLEEKFNVNILPDSITETEKWQLSLSTGEIPDCGNFSSGIGEAGIGIRLYDEGVIRTIPLKMIQKYMPLYSKIMDESGYGWQIARAPGKDDEYLSLLSIIQNVDGPNWHLAFRYDIALELGMDPLPNFEKMKISVDDVGEVWAYTGKIPYTWYEEYMKRFIEADIDGNGVKDSIGLSACKYFVWSFGPFLDMFGVHENYNVQVNGKLYEWVIAPQFKDFLNLMAKWYSMDLIDKEFLSLDVVKMWEKQTNQKAAVMVAPSDYCQKNGEHTRPPNNLATAEDVAKGSITVLAYPPVGPDGFFGAGIYMPFTMTPDGFHIGVNTSDEKLAKILELLDYKGYDPEGSLLTLVGKPGIHYTWNGTPWKSSFATIKPENVQAGYPSRGGFDRLPYRYTKDFAKFLYHEKLYDFLKVWSIGDKGHEIAIFPYKWDLFDETKYNEKKAKYGELLKTIYEEFMYNAITGQIDIDAEWDKYVAKWRKNGGDELLAELEKAPITKELRKGKLVY